MELYHGADIEEVIGISIDNFPFVGIFEPLERAFGVEIFPALDVPHSFKRVYVYKLPLDDNLFQKW